MATSNKRQWRDMSVRERATTILVILVIVIALITLKGLIFGNSGNDSTEANVTTETLSPEQRIESAVNAALDGNSKVRELQVTKQVGDGYGVFLRYNNETTASERFIGSTMADVYMALYGVEDLGVQTASIVTTLTLSNAYGDSKEVPIIKTTLDKETAAKVSFDTDKTDLRYTILPSAWTVNMRHKALEE